MNLPMIEVKVETSKVLSEKRQKPLKEQTIKSYLSTLKWLCVEFDENGNQLNYMVF